MMSGGSTVDSSQSNRIGRVTATGRYLPVVVIKAVVREVQTGQCPVMRVERTELTKRRVSAMADLLSVSWDPKQSQCLKFAA